MARFIPEYQFEIEVPLTVQEATRQWEEHLASRSMPETNRFARAFQSLARKGFGKTIFAPLVGIEVRAGQLIRLCMITVHLVPKPVMGYRVTGVSAVLCLIILIRHLVQWRLAGALSSIISVAVVAYIITRLLFWVRCQQAKWAFKWHLQAD